MHCGILRLARNTGISGWTLVDAAELQKQKRYKHGRFNDDSLKAYKVVIDLPLMSIEAPVSSR